MLEDIWFIAQAGVQSGPYSAEEVRGQIEAGGLHAGALIWRPGMHDWTPITAHFDGATRNAPAPVAPRVSEPAPVPTQGGWASAIAVLALTAVAVVCMAVLYSDFNFPDYGLAAPYLYAATWLSAVVSVLVATVLIWRRGGQPGAGWPWQAGKAVSAVATFAALALTLVFVRATGTMYNIAQARETYGAYELEYDPAGRTIYFSGTIGPRFAARLEGILQANAGVETFYIVDSPGGLIDEALAASRALERWPTVAVQVEGDCNSACMALYMAGAERRAEYGARFGFHRSDSITDVPAFVQAVVDESGDEMRDYIVARGFPAQSFDQFARSNELHMVSAIELAEMQIVTKLLVDGVETAPQRAKWLWIAEQTAVADNGFADLATALADANDPALLAQADPIFAAALTEDVATVQAAVLALLPVLLPRVLESADPPVALAYLHASADSINYLASMQQWEVCAGIVDGRGSGPNAVPASLVRAELTQLAAAVRSASAAGWVSRPLPSWAASAGQSAINDTIAAGARQGLNNLRFESDPRTRCLLTHGLMVRIYEGDPVRGVVAYRWISANGG
ncbi:MAG: GYF domain-containing protein [Hyphomonadaceae bacterium]